MIVLHKSVFFADFTPFLKINLHSFLKVHVFVDFGGMLRGTFKSKAPLRVQFSPALGGEGVGKG